MKIQSLPKNRIIEKSGIYYIKKDIHIKKFSKGEYQFGILVTRGIDVIIDFQGHSLLCDEKFDDVNFGVLMKSTKNVHIKNAVIKGFYYGIHVGYACNSILENNQFDNIKYIALSINSDVINITNNTIKNLNFYVKKPTRDNYIIAISLTGTMHATVDNNRILNNYIDKNNMNTQLEYVGILVKEKTKQCIIKNNILVNQFIPYEQSYAVWCAEGTSVVLSDNEFINHAYDIASKNSQVITYKTKEKQGVL